MKGKFPISGTFIDEITYDIPCANWTKEQWIADIDNMREVGIDTLLFIRPNTFIFTVVTIFWISYCRKRTNAT